MPTLNFGEYRPDVNDLDGQHSRYIRNVLARGDGYGPVKDLQAFSAALGERCRGYFYSRDVDGTINIFAGTSTRLYQLDNETLNWVDRSFDGDPYDALPADAQWQFEQFGNFVLAVHANVDPQAFDITADTEFADLAGAPPRAAFIAIVGRFVVLSGLTVNPYRTQWSALNDITNWTAGTFSSDFQDAPDGGIVRRVLGGEYGFILQDQVIRRMTFSPGSDVIFVIVKIAKDIGLLHPYAACSSGDKIFFLSPKGFIQTDANGALAPIGAEKIDRTFLASYDSSAPELIQMAADPNANTVLCTYRLSGSTGDYFDRALAYNHLIQRWTPIEIEGEFITALATPGYTLEGLGAIAPGVIPITGAADNGSGGIRITVGSTATLTTGEYKSLSSIGGTTEANGTWLITVINGTTFDLGVGDEGQAAPTFANAYTSGGIVEGSADDMDISWDALGTGTLARLSVCNILHEVSFMSGDNIEAELETPEQSGDGQRLLVDGFWPITDASEAYGRLGKRDNLRAAFSYTPESTMNDDGYCPQLWSTRYVRGRVRIPAAIEWTFASGVRPESQPDGER